MEVIVEKEKGRNRSKKGRFLYPLELLKRVFVNSSNTCLLSLFRSIRGGGGRNRKRLGGLSLSKSPALERSGEAEVGIRGDRGTSLSISFHVGTI